MALNSAPGRIHPGGAPAPLSAPSRAFLGTTRERPESDPSVTTSGRLRDAGDDIHVQQMASWVFITVSDEDT